MMDSIAGIQDDSANVMIDNNHALSLYSYLLITAGTLSTIF